MARTSSKASKAPDKAPWSPASAELNEANAPPMGQVWSADLTEADKQIRDKFAREYVEDYDAGAAALRCGYTVNYAVHYARLFMGETYTRQRIAQLEQEMGATNEKEVWRQRITRSLWREATNKGSDASHGARVSALKEIKNMYGLDAPVETKLEVKSPVTFYMPDNGRATPAPAAEPDTPPDVGS